MGVDMPRGRFDEMAAVARQFMAQMQPRDRDEVDRQAEALPLRRDMVTLLAYVRDNRVIGTQSAGNLPLKAIREVTARFVHPPKLEETIGDHTYRVRSAEHVWPLYYLHILADVGGLVDAGRARRWRLRPQGEKFLAADPWSQVSYLLSTWWHRVNWLVAYPFGAMGESLPPGFSALTLASLHALPVKKRIDFDKFADQLIQATGLTWTAPDMSFAPMFLHGAVERMILGILVNFGAVELEYQDKPLGRGTIREPVAFQITPFGQQLLEALMASERVRKLAQQPGPRQPFSSTIEPRPKRRR